MKQWVIIVIIVAGSLGLAAFLLFQSDVSESVPGDNAGKENSNSKPTTVDINDKLAILQTSMGEITIEFYPSDAPRAVANFIGLALKNYYNNVTFHRVVRDFVIQSGDPTGTGRGGDSVWGGTFADELNPQTPSYQAGYRKGVVAMANRGPNTNTSQFFIMLKDGPLDHLYTIFGKVVAGQEVVDKIGAVPVNPENDKPVEDVVIKSVEIKNK